jgi:hypothetical protein
MPLMSVFASFRCATVRVLAFCGRTKREEKRVQRSELWGHPAHLLDRRRFIAVPFNTLCKAIHGLGFRVGSDGHRNGLTRCQVVSGHPADCYELVRKMSEQGTQAAVCTLTLQSVNPSSSQRCTQTTLAAPPQQNCLHGREGKWRFPSQQPRRND